MPETAATPPPDPELLELPTLPKLPKEKPIPMDNPPLRVKNPPFIFSESSGVSS
jgi:hypothetical protein